MNRLIFAAVAIGCMFMMADTASAQRRGGRGCVPSYGSYTVRSYTTPYYSYRSYGPGTHISRYAVPPQTIRRTHSVSRSTHYRLPSQHYYGVRHPYPYYGSPYGPVYGRNGVSFSIRF